MQTRFTHEDIEQMIKAHIDLLMHHLSYISAIKKRSIEPDEIRDYVYDLIHCRVNIDEKFYGDHLLELEKSIRIKANIFFHFLRIVRHQDSRIALSGLYLAMKSEIYYASLDSAIARSTRMHFSEKLQTALHHAEHLKILHHNIESALPVDHTKLQETFVHSVKRVRARRNEIKGAPTTYAIYEYKWDKLKKALDEAVKKIFNIKSTTKKTKNEKFIVPQAVKNVDGFTELLASAMIREGIEFIDDEQTNQFVRTIQTLHAVIDTMQAEDEAYLRRDFSTETSVGASVYDHLLKNVTAFYGMIDQFNEVMHRADQGEKLSKLIESLSSSVMNGLRKYARLKADINTKSDELVSLAKRLKKSFTVIAAKHSAVIDEDHITYIRMVNERLTIVIETTESSKTILGTDFNAKMCHGFLEQVSNKHKEMCLVTKRYLGTLQQFESNLLALIEKSKLAEAAAKAPEVSVAEARQLLLAEQQVKDEEWKALVASKRRDKKVLQSPPVVMTQPVIATAPEQLIHVNITMQERLSALTRKHLDVLLALFKLEPGVRYQKIYNIITKRLEGTVEEYGGSHKRIKIGKCYSVVSNNQPDPERDSVATGGMFKPHGKAHQSGQMSRFNMQLVVKTFESAGITRARIEELMLAQSNGRTLRPGGQPTE